MKSSPSASSFRDEFTRFLAPTTIPADIDVEILHGSGDGMYVWTTSGQKMLVANSDHGVTAVGYRHPALIKFRRRYPELLDFCDSPGVPWRTRKVHTGYRDCEISQSILAERLIKLAFPDDDPGKYMVRWQCEGGPLVFVVLQYLLHTNPGKGHFLTFEQAFHGRFTSLTRSNPEPLEFMPAHVNVDALAYPQSAESLIRALRSLEFVPKRRVNAYFIEGVQGEGGINRADPALLPALHGKLGALIPGIRSVWDEIQSGLGRTGKWFSFQYYYGVKPDVVIMGKSLGGSAPLYAAVMPKADLPDGWQGGTFTGHPAGIAQAMVLLDIIEYEGLVENAWEMGAYLVKCFEQAPFSHRLEKYVAGDMGEHIFFKGLGLMQGVEFRDGAGGPHPEWRNAALKLLRERGILTSGAGMAGINPTIRIMPMLIVDRATIDYLVTEVFRAIRDSLNMLRR